MDVSKFMSGDWVVARDLPPMGETATILNEGEEYVSESNPSWGTKIKLLVEINASKQQKYLTLNKVALAEISKAWGKESKAWVGKNVLLMPVSQSVRGEIKQLVNIIPNTRLG